MIKIVISILLFATPVVADIVSAEYIAKTSRYNHGVFGNAVEFGGISLQMSNEKTIELGLPGNRVFEDRVPRLADMDGDGDLEVIVVETDVRFGAQLAIYDENGKIAGTRFIGRTHRWLAPAGIGDFDGDGINDVAYVETPHLGMVLKFYSLVNGRLKQIAEVSGLSNHRFGDPEIAGGVRVCDGVTEVITASGDWHFVMATRLVDGEPVVENIGPYVGPASFVDALACL